MRLAGWRSRNMLTRYAASAADQRARDAHRRVALGPHHVPIDPFALARQYGVLVVALSQLPCEERHHFLQLSGEILLPTDGAFRLATRDASDSDAATAFDVSLAVARWRMNASGARTVIGRARQKNVQRSR